MSNILGWYTKGVEHFMRGDINLLGGNIKCVIINEALYTVNMDTNEFLSDIPVGARVATVALAGVAVTGGLFKCTSPLNYGILAAGPALNACAFYQDSGSPATSLLIGFAAGNAAMGFPITPDGIHPIQIFITGTNGVGKLGGHT